MNYVCIIYIYMYTYMYKHIYLYIHIHIYIYTYKTISDMIWWYGHQKNLQLFGIHFLIPRPFCRRRLGSGSRTCRFCTLDLHDLRPKIGFSMAISWVKLVKLDCYGLYIDYIWIMCGLYIDILLYWYLVGAWATPLKNMSESQWGWRHSQYMGK